ncbi:MAG: MerR family transcriptional regulator [Gemmatimonadales bacterium]
MSGPAELIRIGALAATVGVSPDTLRHYERRGLLRPSCRTASGYRLYDERAVERVRLIRNGLEVGLSLRELAVVLAERDKGGAPCRKVRALVADRLVLLERRLADLAEHRDALVSLLADWDRRLDRSPPGRRAGLLGAVPRRATSSRGIGPG